MCSHINLVASDGTMFRYKLSGKHLPALGSGRFTKRVAYAAAHVVLDPLRTTDPIYAPSIDWDATLRFREHLWGLGFGVAEAMDTSQRGMGLDWSLAKELISRSAAAAGHRLIASGAGTDHLPASASPTLEEIVEAYQQQCAAVEAAGSRVILMSSRALAKVARGPEDYLSVYSRILEQTSQPVILHWLGPTFDPLLENYWGSPDPHSAMHACLALIREHSSKIDGIKVSLLDADLEIQMRRQLPETVKMYTGDDFHYDRLIRGDDVSHSHALLGIFDAIAIPASLALQALDKEDFAQYDDLLAPTVPLSRCIFQKPTFYYKTGLVLLAYLNGFQNHFRMVSGQESARSVAHLCELFRLADAAGVLSDPQLASERMKRILLTAGVE